MMAQRFVQSGRRMARRIAAQARRDGLGTLCAGADSSIQRCLDRAFAVMTCASID